MSSLQEIFNTIVVGARKQNCQSKKGNGIDGFFCVYRGNNGRKCFVGMLIDDEDYVPEMEQTSIGILVKKFANKPSIAKLQPFADQLGELQMIHDFHEPKQWEDDFKFFAKEYKLTIPPIG